MNVLQLADQNVFSVAAGADGTENTINDCYIGDLLSLAMARVKEGTAWITIQTNINIVAVASLADAACIIIADGFAPDAATVQKADAVNIPVLTTEMTAYEIAKILAKEGI